MEFIRVEPTWTDREAIAQAVAEGEIEGDVYRDGEVWVSPESLLVWRETAAQLAVAEAQ